ncbi:amidoligase family protein [Marivita hallyeonensis]|uniref:Putative amidoligase enzyme n=1 Tax=Marivita hallyeonensis TaxID=996342 RepID=A0A1M5MMY6_9RHOB|nr:amidoligase family protein [Marivita hallyeonensis]SHG78794.1 Putative amidoligase enzyme [Marivita hallyeonensis]
MTNNSRFQPLPFPDTSDGDERLVGVEIEFSGLDEAETAKLIKKHLGGEKERDGAHAFIIKDTKIGKMRVELDTALRKVKGVPLLDEGLSLARGLVPVEIVTDPIARPRLVAFDDFLAILRENGALGSRAGAFLGFGVHLNPQVVDTDHPHTLKTFLAFGLLEDWLRDHEDLDNTRRILPFVRAWPQSLLSEMCTAMPENLTDMMALYAKHIVSRNHGLDCLPLFKHHDPGIFEDLFPDDKLTSARPTFHFRMPDCRIDEDTWSLDQSWELWRVVEETAANDALLGQLMSAWQDHENARFISRKSWVETVDDHLETRIEKGDI